jgi:protein gp37
MGDRTEISWTDATWSCLRGCSRTIAAGATTSGCGDPSGGGCYAERNGYRFAAPGLPYEGLVRMTPNGARWTGKVMLVDKHLLDPIRWERPRRIFTTSVSDPFHERYSNEMIALIFGVMAVTQRHIHQLLTKRVRRMREWYEWLARVAAGENGGRGVPPAAYCFALLQRYVRDRTKFSDADSKLLSRSDLVDAAFAAPWPLPNVWPMASVEHQPAADDRVPELLRVPGVVHGLSCEPLIGGLYLTPYLAGIATRGVIARDGSLNERPHPPLGWVIAGCESGPGARPCDPAWLRSLRDQCAAAGVPFFLKQAREKITPLAPDGSHEDAAPYAVAAGPGSKLKAGSVIELPYLDGVQHAAFPITKEMTP